MLLGMVCPSSKNHRTVPKTPRSFGGVPVVSRLKSWDHLPLNPKPEP